MNANELIAVLVFLLMLPHLLVLLFLLVNMKRVDLGKPIETADELSIVIPFRNESKRIGPLIDALKRQLSVGTKIEILLVDDHSEDDSAALIESLGLPTGARILTSEGKGKKEALLTGIRESAYTTILCLDADTVPEPEAISGMLNIYRSQGLNMLCGPVRLQGKSAFQKSQAIESAVLVSLSAVSLNMGYPATCNGANLMFNKDLFFQLGGYKTEKGRASGDDDLLMQRFAKHDLKRTAYTLSENCMVNTPALENPAEFIQQRRRWLSKRHDYIYNSNRFYHLAYALRTLLLFCLPVLIFLGLSMSMAVFALLFILELLVFLRLKKAFRLSVHPFFILYQFYPLLLIFGYSGKLSWKGREIR